MAPNFTKLKIILFFWNAEKKSLGQANFQKIRELFIKKLSLSSQKYGFGIRDPVSGKNPFRILDPGVKRHRILDPGSGAQHCWECYTFSRGDVGIWCLNIIWSIFENFKIWNRNEHFGLNFRELRNNFLGLKYLNSLMLMRIRFWESFWPWIQDGKTSDPGSGINILDTQHWYKV